MIVIGESVHGKVYRQLLHDGHVGDVVWNQVLSDNLRTREFVEFVVLPVRNEVWSGIGFTPEV